MTQTTSQVTASIADDGKGVMTVTLFYGDSPVGLIPLTLYEVLMHEMLPRVGIHADSHDGAVARLKKIMEINAPIERFRSDSPFHLSRKEVQS
jgi:hypothetical protein